MHADTEQLLSVASGAPVDASVSTHLTRCARCQLELQRLQRNRAALQALPSLEPPPHAWQRIEERLDRRQRLRQPRLYAIAAALALAATATLWWAARAPEVIPAPAALVAATPEQAPVADDAVDALLVESQRLERVLRQIESQAPGIMTTATAGTIAGLEDGIAVIDYGLTNAESLSDRDSQDLWSRRVALMNSLVQVRGAQLHQVSN